MNVWQRLQKLRPKQLAKLFVVFIKNPSYIFPSIRATKRTVAICNAHFGNKHHKNNPANAFRHALWNLLLCQAVFKIEHDLEKATNWAKTLTDLHEEFAFSTELAKAMDLHNNAVGRKLFEEKHPIPENESISILNEMANNAKQLKFPEETEKYVGELVFIK